MLDNLGVFQLDDSRFNTAEMLFQRAIVISSTRQASYVRLGNVYVRSGLKPAWSWSPTSTSCGGRGRGLKRHRSGLVDAASAGVVAQGANSGLPGVALR